MPNEFPPEVQACVQVYEGQLATKYVTQNGTSLFSDAKAYFLSDEFQNDYQNKKWEGSIGVSIDGVPFNLGAGSNSGELKEFRKKIESGHSILLKTNSYSTLSVSTGNVEMAKQFNKCIQDRLPYGPSVIASESEDGLTVSVIVSYRKVASTDLSPKIAFVQVKGVTENDATNLGNKWLPEGATMPDSVSFSLERIPGTNFSISINTDNGVSTDEFIEGNPIIEKDYFPEKCAQFGYTMLNNTGDTIVSSQDGNPVGPENAAWWIEVPKSGEYKISILVKNPYPADLKVKAFIDINTSLPTVVFDSLAFSKFEVLSGKNDFSWIDVTQPLDFVANTKHFLTFSAPLTNPDNLGAFGIRLPYIKQIKLKLDRKSSQ